MSEGFVPFTWHQGTASVQKHHQEHQTEGKEATQETGGGAGLCSPPPGNAARGSQGSESTASRGGDRLSSARPLPGCLYNKPPWNRDCIHPAAKGQADPSPF